jgi:hypothetical protein
VFYRVPTRTPSILKRTAREQVFGAIIALRRARPFSLSDRHCMEPLCVQTAIDELVARFFSVFDNRNGTRPLLANLVDCFAEKATIVRCSDTGTELFTVSEFAIPRIDLLSQGALLDFHEWEIDSTTQVFGGIATRTSRYSKAGSLNGNPYCGLGTKCFQLVRMGSAWHIASLAWVDDNA